jgi:hypothetical protein
MSPSAGQKIGRVRRHLGLGHERSVIRLRPGSSWEADGQIFGGNFPEVVIFALFQNVWASCEDSLADCGRLRMLGVGWGGGGGVEGRGGVSWPGLAG